MNGLALRNTELGNLCGFHLVHRQIKIPCSDQGWVKKWIAMHCIKLANSQIGQVNHSNIKYTVLYFVGTIYNRNLYADVRQLNSVHFFCFTIQTKKKILHLWCIVTEDRSLPCLRLLFDSLTIHTFTPPLFKLEPDPVSLAFKSFFSPAGWVYKIKNALMYIWRSQPSLSCTILLMPRLPKQCNTDRILPVFHHSACLCKKRMKVVTQQRAENNLKAGGR